MRENYTDQEIVEEVREGGQKKENVMRWLCRHDKYLKHSRIECRNFDIKDHHRQLTLFHNSLIKLYISIENYAYNPEMGSILSYWRGIHRNLCLEEIRERKKEIHREKIIKSLHSEYSEDENNNDPEKEMLYRKIKQFELNHEKCGKILSLFAAGYDMQEIANKLGYASAGTVRVIKSRCLKGLKKFLGNE